MNSHMKWALVAGLALAGMSLAAGSAAALPAKGLDGAVEQSAGAAQKVQPIRYICGYWRCRWVPNPSYWAGPYPGGPYWGGSGRHWHHRHHWHGHHGHHRHHRHRR